MRQLLITMALVFGSMIACAKDTDKSGSTATATEEFPTMTVADVDQALAAKQVQAVDCNGERTRKKHGVVPGAILISDEEEYPASELPADKTTKLVFYCADPG
jgi:rhodanese-like protein